MTNPNGTSQYDGLLAEKKKLRRRAEFRNTLPLYLMMLPGLIYIVCNNYLPMEKLTFLKAIKMPNMGR